MNRRTFLRVLGSAMAIAVVAPSIPALVDDTITIWKPRAVGPSTLTCEMLEHAYRACVIGQEAPNLMIIPASMARRLGLVYDVDLDDVQVAV